MIAGRFHLAACFETPRTEELDFQGKMVDNQAPFSNLKVRL
jgi:hypothetical protein